MTKEMRNKGFVYPGLNCIFSGLEHISILYWLKNKKQQEQSLTLVDLYVVCWFIWSIISILILITSRWSSLMGHHWFCNFLVILVLVLAIYRFVDIIQAWWNRYFTPPFRVSAPRNIVLTFVNYWEIIVIFAIVGLFFRWIPYYPEGGHGVSAFAIMTSLRTSLRIATPLGLNEEPPVLWSGLLFYLEYLFGFVFIAVFISVILSYLRNDGTATRKS